MDLLFVIAGGLVLSLPVLWAMNKYRFQVQPDQMIAWSMLFALIVIGGISIWMQSFTNETNGLNSLRAASYILIYITYWALIKARALKDRYNPVAIVTSVLIGESIALILFFSLN